MMRVNTEEMEHACKANTRQYALDRKIYIATLSTAKQGVGM